MSTIQRPNVHERSFLTSFAIFFLISEVFLLPLFFLPWTFEIFEFNKQHVLWLLTFGAAWLWLMNTLVIEKRLVYRRTPLDLPIILLLVAWGISASVGLDPFSSWFGLYGRFSDAYLTTLACVLNYFLINALYEPRHIRQSVGALMASASLTFGITILSLAGVLRYVPVIGLSNLLQSRLFTVYGASWEGVAVFAAAIVVLVAALYAHRDSQHAQSVSWVAVVAAVLAGVVLLLVNVPAAWMVVALGGGILCAFALYASAALARQGGVTLEVAVAPGITLFLVGIVFIFILSGQGGVQLTKVLWNLAPPREAAVPLGQAYGIMGRSFKDNPLFGSGPGTFLYQFSRFRSESFNSHPWWQIRFDKAPTAFIEMPVTTGAVGTIAFLAVIFIFFYVSIVFLRHMFRAPAEESRLGFALSFAAVAFLLVYMVYIVSVAVQVYFWFCLAAAMVSWRFAFAKIFSTTVVDMASWPAFRPVAGASMVVASTALVYIVYIVGVALVADISYNTYRLSNDRTALERAVRLMPARSTYHIALAQDYIADVREDIRILSTPGISEEQAALAARQARLQQAIANALREAKAGVSVSPASVATWEWQGALYRDVKAIAVGSVEPAVESFERAVALEPTNPILHTELGKLYLARQRTNNALESFERAIALKPDYYDAYAGLAETYVVLGQADKALVALEEVIQQQPQIQLLYEAGKLYYNQKNYEKAIERLGQVVAVQPDHANARYILGLSYQKQGNTMQALEQLQKVLEMNPGNEEVKKTVEELQ